MKKILLIASLLFTSYHTNAAQESSLKLDVYNADSNSFTVNATVLYSDTEAVVVDTGFTKADALRIAAKVYDSGKQLTTIFISQADPDYYFGAEVLHELFPNAQIITTSAVGEVIAEKRDKKVAFWGPKMGLNAPVKPIIPATFKGTKISVDQHIIEIKIHDGVLAHRPYLWIPETKTILGNVAISAGHHVWMADTQTPGSVNAWLEQLNQMKALQPLMVIPGHMEAGTALDDSAINFTIDYIKAFIKAKTQSTNSSELIAKMAALYPHFKDTSSLELGAKVHMGEMPW
ncbi:MBL fold metallo-hydrolase [Pseudoalteromonas sp. NEC-BIFX-2020_002]|uniref:MBL fold metallo-hydrolase n=1 Tax=Pseudoalteromonas sp. NEC-BIFX-2020_002 TaxID=2732353 RepID=UPI001476C385|nr:MBL fold metallo-hydrolase [Pseudoalteromonas sp. NEC-BIFX-2020_002]NNG43978.1 MBL fold metallo-hydrolase [Pseudoalteromonas sp. NEC-BIFX-2020_002]